MKRWMPMVLAVVTAVLVSAPASTAEETPEKAAEAAASSWLAIVDSGKYGESWDAAAAYFRQALTRVQWEDSVGKARGPLGKVISRKLRSAQYATAIPNAPAGEYVIIQYDTSFANRSGLETIVPMKEKDGAWRVSGYFVK